MEKGVCWDHVDSEEGGVPDITSSTERRVDYEGRQPMGSLGKPEVSWGAVESVRSQGLPFHWQVVGLRLWGSGEEHFGNMG